MIAGFLSVLLFFAAALPAAAADSLVVQTTWTAGAVSGSSTALLSGWEAYDDDDGNVVILSTAFESKSNRAGLWFQTDDSTDTTGFHRSTTSLSLSSAVVKGSGTGASVAISTFEAVTAASSLLPAGRSQIGVAYHPTLKRFYLFGGVNANGSLSNQILEYDPAALSLSVKSNALPTARAGTTAAYDSIAGKIYIFGGSLSGGSKVADIFEYNPIGNTLMLEPAALPTSRANMASVYDTGTKKIYLFGGDNFDGSKLDSIVSYEGAFDTLVQLSTPLPSARSGVAASFDPVSQKAYLFGGEDSAGLGLAEILEFDANNSTWTLRDAVLPSTRTQSGAAYHGLSKKSYVLGGVTSGGTTDSVLEYDAVADTLAVRNPVLLSSRAAAGAGFDGVTGGIYLFGGDSTPGGGRLDQILKYTFFSSATFTSSVFDTGNKSDLQTLSFSPASPFDPAVGLSLSFRAGDSATPDLSWSNAGAFLPVPNGGSIASMGPARYVQYRATFTTTNISTSAVLADVSVTYTQTAPTAALVSSAFDLGADQAVLRKLTWEGSFASGTGAQLQLRTAPDAGGTPGTFGPWTGPSGGNFYTDPAGSVAIDSSHADGVNDRFVQYRAILYSTSTLAAPNVSSVTIAFNVLPASPTFTSLIALSSNSIVATFVDRATTEDQIMISTGFLPNPTASGTTIPTSDKAGTGTIIVSTISGFPPNTAVFVRARAQITADALDSFFSDERSTFTLANPPQSLSASAVFGTSITLTWNAASNPSGTLYEISLSTDDFVLNVSTPFAFADTLTGTTTDLVSLAGGTTYYVRMRAQNGNLVRTAFSAVLSTPTNIAPVTTISGVGVGVSSIVFSWNSGGPSAQYRVFPSTGGPALTTVATSSVAVTGLSPNTTFAIRVEPFNATSNAGLSPAATAYSLSAEPVFVAAVPLSTGSLSLSWSGNGNPPVTPYEITISTDDFLTSSATAAAFSDAFTAQTTTYANLAAGTTYSFRLRSQNGDGLPSGVATASTQTLPGVIAALSGTALGASSLTWTWSNAAGPTVEFYRIYRGSTGVELATTTATSFLDAGLLANTTYGLLIRAVNLSGEGSLSAETTAQTLARPPTGTSVAAVFIDSVTLSWNTNLNPVETAYSLERSTDGVAFAVVAASAAASASDVNLIADSTYYYRVRSLNGAGIPSPYDAVVSTFLAGKLPDPPSAFSARSLSGGRVHLSWTISPSTTVVVYNLYTDSGTGTIDYTTLFAAIPAPSTSYTTVPLPLSTTYLFGLRAKNEKGEEEKNTHVVAAAITTAAPAALVASIRAPPPGTRVSGDHVTLRAGLDEGSYGDVSRILFEYRAAGAGAWTAVSAVDARHPNPAVARPFTTHWNTAALPAGVYDLRATARDASGADDPAPPFVRVRVDSILPDFEENRGTGNRVIQRVRVYRAAPVTAEVSDNSGDWLLRVALSSAVISNETDILRIDTDPAAKPVFTSSFAPAGIFTQITLESGQTAFTAGRTATITLSHLDRDGNNRVDGTEVRADNLRLAVYDAALGRWTLSIPSAATAEDELSVSGTTPHFSLFAPVSPAAAGVNSIRIYPNPYRPSNAIDDDGKPWTAADPTSGIVFDDLPASGEISIYTVTGSVVWRSFSPIAGGLLRWDAKNGDGRDVASGIYFAVFTDSDGNAAVGKLAVIR
ncbi:MAG: hypothetical protein AUJ52_09865 [Elusimicrobia bacterium CG1_02_63_36]|nr:MAG: hypothetical protein AUJ52_09865 [Elusimicrobia bacterium CG1_02_63_36]